MQILEDYEGKNKNNLEYEKMNCYICSKGTKKYKKPDKYIIALSKLYENEEQIYYSKEDYNKKDKEQINIEKNDTKKEKMKRKRKIWFQKKNKKKN